MRAILLKYQRIQSRRDGRVVEGARLESVFRGNSNVGSNPTLSAIVFFVRGKVQSARMKKYLAAKHRAKAGPIQIWCKLWLPTLGSSVYTCLELEAKMGNVRSLSVFVGFLSTFVPLSAQWLHYSTPGIPRTPDGKANLLAPAPKTPDANRTCRGSGRGPMTSISGTS